MINILFLQLLKISLKINFSFSISNDDVASSKKIICGSLKRTLAKPIRCFCPPEIFIPLSPNEVSIPSLRFFINFSSLTVLITWFKLSSSLELFPKVILFLIVSLKSIVS